MENILLSYVSWGAIFAGLIMILAFQFMFSSLGLALGLWKIKPAEEKVDVKKLGMGAGAWWIISSIISVYLGALVSANLAGNINTFNAILHGITTWGLSVIVSEIIMASAAGAAIFGAAGMVAGGLNKAVKAAQSLTQATAPKAEQAMQETDFQGQWSQMKGRIQKILSETEKPELQPENLRQKGVYAKEEVKSSIKQSGQEPQSSKSSIESVLKRIMEQGSSTSKSVDKQAVVNVLEKETQMSHEQAERTAEQWISTYQRLAPQIKEKAQEIPQKAKEAAQQTSQAVATASMLTFVMMVLTFIAAVLGALSI